MTDMKLAIMGAAGRMGRELAKAIHDIDGCVIAGAIEQPGSLAIGQDVGLLAGLGKLGTLITDDALEVIAKVDGILDFTVPKASVELASGMPQPNRHADRSVRCSRSLSSPRRMPSLRRRSWSNS